MPGRRARRTPARSARQLRVCAPSPLPAPVASIPGERLPAGIFGWFARACCRSVLSTCRTASPAPQKRSGPSGSGSRPWTSRRTVSRGAIKCQHFIRRVLHVGDGSVGFRTESTTHPNTKQHSKHLMTPIAILPMCLLCGIYTNSDNSQLGKTSAQVPAEATQRPVRCLPRVWRGFSLPRQEGRKGSGRGGSINPVSFSRPDGYTYHPRPGRSSVETGLRFPFICGS